MVPPSTTSRRDRIKNLRDGLADNNHNDDDNNNDHNAGMIPPSSSRDSSQMSMLSVASQTAARLEQSLKETLQDKRKALEQVAQLEEQLLQAREQQAASQAAAEAAAATVAHTTTTKSSSSSNPSTPQPKSLQKMLQISDEQGEQAALQWARSQVVGVPPLSMESIGSGGAGSGAGMRMMMSASPGPRLMDDRRRGPPTAASRTMAPQPKLLAGTTSEEAPNMVAVERQLIPHFREAATCIPYEYDSPLATFFIRRPYGMTTPATTTENENENENVFDKCSVVEQSLYARKAHVSTTTTLEVAAILKANQSLLCLWDASMVRYQESSNTEDWKTVNLDALDRPLGMMTYIDNEGVERDYSLDQVVEEAFLVREQYCRTLTSTALGFKDRPVVEKIVHVLATTTTAAGAGGGEGEKAAAAAAVVDTSDMAVDTSDIPYPPAEINVPKKKEDQATATTATATTVTKKEQAPEEPASGASGDVLAIFLGMIFKNIFALIWWLLIGLPLAILKTTLVGVVVMTILSMVYLYLLDEHHNGHSISFLATTSYHQNAAGLGIM
jgi:hypothetical protein